MVGEVRRIESLPPLLTAFGGEKKAEVVVEFTQNHISPPFRPF